MRLIDKIKNAEIKPINAVVIRSQVKAKLVENESGEANNSITLKRKDELEGETNDHITMEWWKTVILPQAIATNALS